MKRIFTIAMVALSVGAFAQQRQLVKQDDYRSESRYQQNDRYGKNDYRYQNGKYSFTRLDLTNRQERQLVDLLKDKQNDERYILKKYRNPEQKLRMLDREYDRAIQNLLSRSQYEKWNRIYAYQYETYGNKRWS
ncbi:hypothetical protein H1R17_05690 [Flavobacterium sp. xlx-214]|uniref:hypothetical protein n=1 Tax=unclassified Flavobacterium TaxID=196869 RepID=UPI0013D7D500|nr:MULTISPECIES: hypothetical protein [unclassified Flavobacterium]MBA5793057.1 hypothetical protein [Flavobacterium sp. xlx-221]QMI84615.1 hypothetical protein H1R17_05690 [Flavobacterium sp. xlx-214]